MTKECTLCSLKHDLKVILYSVILSEKMNILDLVPQGLDIFGPGENFS